MFFLFIFIFLDVAWWFSVHRFYVNHHLDIATNQQWSYWHYANKIVFYFKTPLFQQIGVVLSACSTQSQLGYTVDCLRSTFVDLRHQERQVPRFILLGLFYLLLLLLFFFVD